MRASGFLLVIGAALCAALSAGCGDDQPEPVAAAPAAVAPSPPEPPPAPPRPEPIGLAELPPVTLETGGQTTIELKIDRGGNKGPAKVEVGAVPEGITVKSADLAEDESEGQIELTASPAVGDTELVTTLDVAVTIGTQTARSKLALHVPQLKLPSFLPAAEVLLQPGASRTVDVEIRRDGYEGPVNLRVEQAPAKVTCQLSSMTAEQSTAQLELTAAADAPEGTHDARVAATLFGRDLAVAVPVKIAHRPFAIDAFRVLTLAPGETQRIELPVERSGYQGELQVTAENLPAGVTVRSVEIAADQKTARLEITATPDAVQHVRSSKLVAVGGQLSTSAPIVIRVSGGDPDYLPPALYADPEIRSLLKRGSIGGRLTSETKQALADFYGGTPESEAAVLRGLRWLAAHQQADGSWPLKDYGKNIPGCDCQQASEKQADDAPTAGTAFGVLPFLGAGVTHNRAPKDPPELAGYQKTVEKGLVFLARSQIRGKDAKDKQDGYLGGGMYAHALGTIALCEAYGLSGDERLKINAQLAIKYLLNAQHTEGGGWRYSPGQPGDMSVTGWVFLAIRSAQLTGIDVLKPPLIRAERFVDSCAVGEPEIHNARYAYQPGEPERIALSAAGLLTRQYLGWKNTEPDLLAGCEYLMQNLPPESGSSLGPIYYYYYATQVLHHMEGPNFDLWNHRIREHLIRNQETEGHKTGSWNPQGADYGERGGRMYATSMALLTLQVYYRHLPMYRVVRRT